ncbi:MAG: prepilin-type N-terminal cleavage/methylation domain-containing protein [Verrucomicrobiales bacterium]|jgi:prepilin-type N-terminal cleavage/methylation domain-containing protein|nr:prepilin-type N-terminal cleavage/methylation domain-containing protein [Verrucomicrobiales bacterium]
MKYGSAIVSGMHRRGFTLVELLVAVTIMITLMAVALPAINAMSGAIGRRGAADQVLLAFEQARVTALSHGVRAYVGFANEAFHPLGAEFPWHAYIIFRERTDADPAGAEFVAVTKWLFLPRHILFQRDCPLFQNAAMQTVSGLPRLADRVTLPVIAYSPTGNIDHSGDLHLYLDEGVSGKVTRGARAGAFAYINLRRFTGRAELVVVK